MNEKKQNENYKSELRITNVPMKTVNELRNISAWQGVPLSGIVKQKLREIINSYPEHMRTTSPDD